MSFANKTIVVTGSASGIGHSILEAFAKKGANVAGLDYNGKAIEKIAKELTDQGYNVCGYKVDVTKKQEIVDTVAEIAKKYNGIDYWVNAAGISHIIPFLETSEEIWDNTLNINLKGQFLSCQEAVKYMLKKVKGQ